MNENLFNTFGDIMKKLSQILSITILTLTSMQALSYASPIKTLVVKSGFSLAPETVYMVKKDKLVKSKLPNGVVCYIASNKTYNLNVEAGERIEVLDVVVEENRNRTLISTENFDMRCTVSIVIWNSHAKLKQIKKELLDLMTIE